MTDRSRPDSPELDQSELLDTKFAVPRPRLPLVSRSRLLARLDESLDYKLTLVSAPAGFGKTTLVAEWIASRGEEHGGPPVAWLSLDPSDNDPVRFWRYVIATLRAFETDLQQTLALLQSPQGPPLETILTAVINDLGRLPSARVLVLEDYHLITSDEIHETLAFLIENLPTTLHVILTTRSDPPLPLAKLRARHELNEIHPAELRFSRDETRAFLEEAVPFPLPSEAIEHLADRTEGWAAGLRLVALALQRRRGAEDVRQFLGTFGGGHRHVLEYLAEEVFEAQSGPVQDFLLRTSFLSRLTGSLCDAITGRDDGAVTLEQLERANLFLVSLDDTHQWYRYHALFAEAMHQYARRRLDEADLHDCYEKASLWYEAQGLLSDAVETALAAQAYSRAATLIDRIITLRKVDNELHTLRRWIEQLPGDILRTYPALCLTLARAIFFSSNRRSPATMARVEEPLRLAEETWRANGDWARLGQALAFRTIAAWWQGDFDQTFAAAREALRVLPEEDAYSRGSSLIFVGLEEMLAGKLNQARQTVQAARTLSEAAEHVYGIFSSTYLLAELCIRQGELHQAAQLYRWLIATVSDEEERLNRWQAGYERGRAILGLATLAYLWNDLDEAERQASQALELGRRLSEDDLVVQGTLLCARVLHARGQTREAQERLQALVAETPHRRPLLLREVHAWQARLSLAEGDIAAVRRWQTTAFPPQASIPMLQQEQEALIVARLLLAQGEAGQALRLLDGRLAEAHAEGRRSSELEIIVLRALAHLARGDLSRAKQEIIPALKQAQPEAYLRLFLDEGDPMRRLLQAVLPAVRDEPLGEYVRTILRAFPSPKSRRQPISSPSLQSAPFIEPLSRQEQRVLRLLAAGCSNPEIAEELVVSVNTVKTHVKSIYRKMDVTSRREVRDTVRALNLF